MLRAAVVPHGDRALGPAVAHGEAGVRCPAGEVAEQHLALGVAELDDAPREVLVHEERLASGHRVDAHHGVHGHAVGAAVRLRVVQRREPLAELPKRRRELLVGLVLVRPHGVAADGGTLHHVQDRQDGGLLLTGEVAVPLVGERAPRGPELEDLGGLRGAGHVRVTLELSEAPPEGDVGLLAQVLVGEEEHEVLDQQVADGVDLGRLRPLERDPADLGAEGPREPDDVQPLCARCGSHGRPSLVAPGHCPTDRGYGPASPLSRRSCGTRRAARRCRA